MGTWATLGHPGPPWATQRCDQDGCRCGWVQMWVQELVLPSLGRGQPVSPRTQEQGGP